MESIRHHPNKLGLIVGESGTQTTHGVGGTNNQRVSQLRAKVDGFLDGGSNVACCHIRPTFQHQVLENLTVFATLNRLKRGANELDVVFFEDSLGVESHGCIERSLTS